jgi:quercetin dioxygenase-like cupin family protein
MYRLRGIVLLSLIAISLAAQGPVEIENEWVRVVRIKIDPHRRASIDVPLPAVGIALTNLKTRDTVRKAGDVYSVDKGPGQTYESVSDQAAELVLVELKAGAPKSPPVKLDPVRLDPEHHPVVLDNERVRVLRTILIPHLKSPMHDHPHYVVVYLTELHTTMTLADGRKVDNPRRPGEIAWRDALSHVTENIGDKTAVEIQVEIK